VMLLSPEMSQEEAESRIDTLICGMYGINIDVNDLIRGIRLNDKQRNVLNEMSKRGDWVTICSDGDRPMTLGEIPRYVRQYNPDLVLVDGMTLIGTKSEAGWSQANDLSQGLKNIAASLSVSILVCQWANQKAGDGTTPPKLSHVYMGDSLAQASDRIVSLFQPKGEIGLRVSIQKFRKGRPKVKALKFKFDPSHGLIYELKPEDNLSENVEDVVEEIEAIP
ncbi:MAG: DnaB-like helicase C-terminal domain-containing protein, partial [Nitrosopumilus sp.]